VTTFARARTSCGEIGFVDEGHGPPVLLLPGFPASSLLWREFVPVLATRFRVLAPDLLGTGSSDKPSAAPLHPGAQADYLRDLLTELGVARFAVVGHGIGGTIAQILAVGGGVQAMVLMDPAAPDDPTANVRSSAARLGSSPEDVRAAIVSVFDRGTAFGERLPDELLESFVAPFAGADGAAAFLRFADQPVDAPTAGEIGGLQMPALIFWGEEDPWWPAQAGERLCEAMPESSFATLPGCSHFLPLDAADTLAPLLFEWLRVRYAGERAHPHQAEDAGPVPISIGRRPAEPPPTGFEDLLDMRAGDDDA
jgi:pimeloyl-ACP methyl ester carboxylesterase